MIDTGKLLRREFKRKYARVDSIYFYPYYLAEQMNAEKRCCIALLHDVVEDIKTTKEELEKDFPGKEKRC